MLEAEYFYKSLPRLQLFFDSPNQCATFLGMLSMVLMGLSVTKWQRREKARKYSLLLFGFGILCLLMILGLVLTYSRGGWIAFLSVIILIKTFSPIKRPLAFLFTGLFLGGVLFFPKGSDRLSSIGDENDKSIKHRLLVWQGAAAMTADHWLTGVGKDQFGKEYKLWYQPLSLKTRYAAALNNYLTLGAERGIFALLGYLLLVTVPLWLVWRIVCENHNAWIQGLLAAQFLFLLSGLFTYSLTIWEVAIFYWILWGFTVIYLIQKTHGNEFKISATKLLPPLIFSLLISLAIISLGFHSLSKIPTTIAKLSVEGAPIFILSPRDKPSSASILFYPESGSDLEINILKFVRPLAEKNYTIALFPFETAGKSTLDCFEKINQWFNQKYWIPRFMIGHGSGGRLGFISSIKTEGFKGILLIGSESRWPFPELSSPLFVAKLQVPLLLLHGSKDTCVNPEESENLKLTLDHFQKKSELIHIPEATHSISEPEFQNQIDRFIQKLL